MILHCVFVKGIKKSRCSNQARKTNPSRARIAVVQIICSRISLGRFYSIFSFRACVCSVYEYDKQASSIFIIVRLQTEEVFTHVSTYKKIFPCFNCVVDTLRAAEKYVKENVLWLQNLGGHKTKRKRKIRTENIFPFSTVLSLHHARFAIIFLIIKST